MRPPLKVLCFLVMVAALGASMASTAVHIDDQHGFVDIDIPITEISSTEGTIRITALGTYAGVDVGFEVDFPAPGANTLHQSIPIGVARLRSIGGPSDRFVALLGERYKLTLPAPTMVPWIDASTAGLQGDLRNVQTTLTEMKFFFYDSGPEERYAEVYINVDGKNRILEFHEKDSEYRKPLLLDLTKGS